MLPPSTMVAALTLMMLATPPLTSMVATPMLMLPSCMELMAMLPPSTMVAAFTLIMLATPPLATPMLMVPDMVHTPTWDKMFYFSCVSEFEVC